MDCPQCGHRNGEHVADIFFDDEPAVTVEVWCSAFDESKGWCLCSFTARDSAVLKQ